MSKRHLRDLTNASLLERRGVPKVICHTTQMQKSTNYSVYHRLQISFLRGLKAPGSLMTLVEIPVEFLNQDI